MQEGAAIELTDDTGATALELAIGVSKRRFKARLEVVTCLLQAGALVDQPTVDALEAEPDDLHVELVTLLRATLEKRARKAAEAEAARTVHIRKRKVAALREAWRAEKKANAAASQGAGAPTVG